MFVFQEHIQSEGKLDRLLQLLEELNDSSFWFDGCSRVIIYCVRYHFVKYAPMCPSILLFIFYIWYSIPHELVLCISSAIGLLKKLKEKDGTSTCFVIDKVHLFSFSIWFCCLLDTHILILSLAFPQLDLSFSLLIYKYLCCCNGDDNWDDSRIQNKPEREQTTSKE